MNYTELKTFMSLLLAMGGGMLVGSTMFGRAYKQEINIEKDKVADKTNQLSQCYNEINLMRSELAYYKTSWSSHLRKVEEHKVSQKQLIEAWDLLSTEQVKYNDFKFELESCQSNNIKLVNRLRKSVKRCQAYKKQVGEMRAKINKLEILGDELYQKIYSLENQLDHERKIRY